MNNEFKNECQYNRTEHTKTNFYTCISNSLIQDQRLDFIEIGIMTKILSNVDSYVFNSTYFYNNTTLSKQQYFNAIDKLCLTGYLEKVKIANGWKWVINETAVEPTPETKQKINDRIDTKDNKRKLRSKTNSFLNPLISTGVNDTGVNDTGVNDTGVNDTGVNDTGVNDTGVNDTGVNDTGVNDTGVNDTGVNDTGVNDTANNVTSSQIISTNKIIEKSDSKESDLNKITNNTISNNTLREILNFGFTEVSFNPIQLKNLNGVIKFFVTNYKLTEDQVKLFIINYYKDLNLNLQNLPIELELSNKDFGQKLLEYINQFRANKAKEVTNVPNTNNSSLNPIIEGKNSTLTSSINSVKPIEFTKLFLGDDYLIYFQNKLTELRTINSSITVDQFEEEIIEYLTGNQFSIETIPNEAKLKIEDWIRNNIQLNTQHIKDMFYNIKEILK